LDFENNRKEYMDVVNCVLNNYSVLFSSAGEKSSVSVYNSEFINNDVCESLIKLLEKHSVGGVNLYRDSTVEFHSKVRGRIRWKQTILVFTSNQEKLKKLLTTEITIKDIKGDGWYELEWNSSIAN